MKKILKRIPIAGPLTRCIYRTVQNFKSPFPGSMDYWRQRYESGYNSGIGSYGKFAEFKAEILNNFVRDNNIETVIEYGCGDGNQLKLAEYPSYIGFDVSPEAISRCNRIFSEDDTKKFILMHEYTGETAELTISLDVIYHLIEDDVFNSYMERLFSSSKSFVIIYSSDTDDNQDNQVSHVKHRKFSEWIDKNQPKRKLLRRIPNKYPYQKDANEGSFADFYIYAKA